MTRTLVAAAALATCAMLLGTPAANAQLGEDTPEPAVTSTTEVEPVEPSEQAEPEAAPIEVEPSEEDGPQASPIEVTLALNPTAAMPGQTVVVTAACDAGDGAPLTSPVLEPVVLTADPEGHQPWALLGTTTVSQDARPGDYEVSADCDGGAVSTTLTVLPAIDGDGEGDDQVDRVPVGAPETGGGPESDPLALVLAVAGLAGAAGLGGLAARRAAQR